MVEWDSDKIPFSSSSNQIGAIEKVMAEPANNFPWNPEHLRLAIEAAGVALWSWNVDTDELTMDKRAFDLWDVPHSETVTFEDLTSAISERVVGLLAVRFERPSRASMHQARPGMRLAL